MNPIPKRVRALAAIGAACCLAGLSSAAPQRFEFETPWIGYPTGIYPAGYQAWGSRTADLNGDGFSDLVVAHWPSNPIFSVIFADGLGGYLPPVEYGLALGAKDVEVADFDGDGDLDLALTSTGQLFEGLTIEIFVNDGTGTFTASGSFSSGKGPNRLTVGDWDGDGDIDLATAHEDYIASAQTVGILLNDGAGGFGPPQIINCNAATYHIASGDLDGDGLPELLVGCKTQRVVRLDNLGGGLFSGPQTLTALGGFSLDFNWCVAVADHDLDGDLDVFYSSTGSLSNGSGSPGIVSIFENTGAGVLAPAVAVLLPEQGGAADIKLADVTGDGVPDLLAAHEIYQFWSLSVGDGSGGFLPGMALNAGESPMQIDVADLDADGQMDVIVLGRDSMEACVYRNPGQGAFVQPVPFDMVAADDVSPSNTSNLEIGDIDGDGDLDAVVGWRDNFGGNTGGISLALNDGTGQFTLVDNFFTSQLPHTIKLRDLEGDGDLDLLFLLNNSASWFYALGDGAGNFGPSLTGGSLTCTLDIAVFDVDLDGDLDVITSGCLGYNEVWLRVGNGYQRGALIDVGGAAFALDGADLNGDGAVDIVGNSGIQGWLEVSINQGDGTFFPAVLVQAGFAVQGLSIADIDGDGILDIVTCDQNGGITMSFLKGRGDGLFLPPMTIPGGYTALQNQVREISTGDVDGDGDQDVLVANYGSQDVSYWRSAGDGTFEPQLRFGVGHQAYDADFGDFDGDGILDVLALVEPESSVTGWYYPAIQFVRGTSADLWIDLGSGLAGSNGLPQLTGQGLLTDGSALTIKVANARTNAAGVFVAGFSRLDVPLLGGLLVPTPDVLELFLTDSEGQEVYTQAWNDTAMAGLSLYIQAWIQDAAGPQGFAATNAVGVFVP